MIAFGFKRETSNAETIKEIYGYIESTTHRTSPLTREIISKSLYIIVMGLFDKETKMLDSTKLLYKEEILSKKHVSYKF